MSAWLLRLNFWLIIPAQVPIAIGGPCLPKSVHLRTDLKEPGLANVGPTIVNLLGFKAPSCLVPSLLA